MGGREGRQEGGWQRGGKERGAHVQRGAQSESPERAALHPGQQQHSAGGMPAPPKALPEKLPLPCPENFA